MNMQYLETRQSPSLHARVTTSGDTQRQHSATHSATHSPDFTHPRHLVPALAQKPANRPETGKAGMANRGWLTAERAKAIGKIGGDKFAASKRGKSTLPRCVGCLLAIGWGIKRIVRHTGWAKTSVHRWAKFNGLNLRATAEQKKRAASKAGWNRRKRTRKPDGYMLRAFVAECGILRSQEAKHWPRWTIVKRGVVTVADKNLSMPKGSAEHMRRLLRCRIYNALIRGSADTARTDRKAMPTMQLVGCSMAKLRRHIEAQFSDGMTWANMGKWHIDHIVPCSAFDLSKPENQQRCFNYKNLRPMWGSANIRKGNLLFDSEDCLPLRAT